MNESVKRKENQSEQIEKIGKKKNNDKYKKWKSPKKKEEYKE